MKKIVLNIFFFLCLFVFIGCGKQKEELKAGEVKENTLLIQEDGSVQFCVVEEFEKDYYKKDELKDFIDKEIAKYNNEVGEKKVAVDSLEVKDNTASVVFGFQSIEDYAQFNQVKASIMTIEEAKQIDNIPNVFIGASESESSVEKETALEKGTVVIVNEELNVKVSGNIKYYSSGILLNDNTLQTAGQGSTVLIFR